MNSIGDHFPAVEDSSFDADTFVHVWLLALVAYGVGDVVTTGRLKNREAYEVVVTVADGSGDGATETRTASTG